MTENHLEVQLIMWKTSGSSIFIAVHRERWPPHPKQMSWTRPDRICRRPSVCMTPAPETNVWTSPDRIYRLVHLGTEVGDTFSVLAECYANSGGMGGDSPLFSTCFLRLTYYYYILSVFQNKRRGEVSAATVRFNSFQNPKPSENHNSFLNS